MKASEIKAGQVFKLPKQSKWRFAIKVKRIEEGWQKGKIFIQYSTTEGKVFDENDFLEIPKNEVY